MEGEVYNLIVDGSILLASLFYCHGVGLFIAQGTTRFMLLFPVICLFLCLPLNLHTMFLCSPTSFFISLLGTFKLILYALGQGPLSLYPPLSLSHFVFTTCLPIKILRNQEKSSQQITKNKKSLKHYVPPILLFIVTVMSQSYKYRLHPLLITSLHAYYLFILLEFLLVLTTFLAGYIVVVEFEPLFDDPHHATSLQNFWGKRWNLVVSNILRTTIYHPSRDIFRYVVPQRWISVPAVFVTFLVSGVMHELVFYHLGRLTPTGELTSFFLIQGACVGMEIVIKKTMGVRFQPPPIVAQTLTLSFVMLISFRLFFPSFLRLDPYGRACREIMAFLGFVKSGKILSPIEYACPFM
ncbi:acyl-CoA--sterol O-acyltransferase 1 [Lactuca sativa]|nr:acyl-CoA--sterol O-acyltransferase 1 [Lactuca sativa]